MHEYRLWSSGCALVNSLPRCAFEWPVLWPWSPACRPTAAVFSTTVFLVGTYGPHSYPYPLLTRKWGSARGAGWGAYGRGGVLSPILADTVLSGEGAKSIVVRNWGELQSYLGQQRWGVVSEHVPRILGNRWYCSVQGSVI